MSERGSKACFACTAYTGNQSELYRLVGGDLTFEKLVELANYASTMARTISTVSADGKPLCALKLKVKDRFPDEIPEETKCDKQSDTTYRACSVPRNLALYKKWLAEG
ncbi:hypothetical protein HZA76_04955 [Candidatus Roizmanbacteria bacterium]|nr:hypothetical protein [Candidatus Roizmanbacteria bacterium]